ncbi:MAG: P-loop NTPase [Acidimicrobiales bacterium]
MTQDYDFLNFDSLEFEGDDETPADSQEYEPEHRLNGGAALAVVDSDKAVSDYLAGLFAGAVDTASSLSELEDRLGLASQVVILGPSCTEPADLAVVERWGRSRPNLATILVTSELSTQLLHKALRAGVKDVLSAPIDQAMLIETVERIAEGLPGAEQLVRGGETHEIAALADGEQGRVISIFSTKGGSGKSVTATNLGVVLARRSQKPVVLLDGHMQFGDVAVMLKLQPQHTAMDAIDQLDNMDPSMMERFLTVHEPSGLYVLPAPMEPTFADQISGPQVARLIEAIRGFAGHVLVDLPAIFNEVVLSVIEDSDEILLVAGLDIPNIKNVKIGLSTLQMLNVPKERLHLVLNRADSKVKLNVSEVERTLGVVAAAHVPSDVVVPISVNKGSPVVISAPKSGVARAFEELAVRFLDGAVAETNPTSGRRKFFG